MANNIVIELIGKDEASKKLLDALGKIKGGVSDLGKTGGKGTTLGGLGDMLGGIGAKGALMAAGVAAAGAAVYKATEYMVGLYKEVTANIDAMGEMADKVGMSIESFSGLAYVAQRDGVELETLNKALATFGNNVATAAHGTDRNDHPPTCVRDQRPITPASRPQDDQWQVSDQHLTNANR